jgi:predicted transglutaminase-like cysteine proteinase
MRESFETGNFDAIPTALTSNSQLSIAVANGPLSSAGYAVLMAEASKNGLILPRARSKQCALDRIALLVCDRASPLSRLSMGT